MKLIHQTRFMFHWFLFNYKSNWRCWWLCLKKSDCCVEEFLLFRAETAFKPVDVVCDCELMLLLRSCCSSAVLVFTTWSLSIKTSTSPSFWPPRSRINSEVFSWLIDKLINTKLICSSFHYSSLRSCCFSTNGRGERVCAGQAETWCLEMWVRRWRSFLCGQVWTGQIPAAAPQTGCRASFTILLFSLSFSVTVKQFSCW